MIPISEEPTVVKFLETESGMVLPGLRRGGMVYLHLPLLSFIPVVIIFGV